MPAHSMTLFAWGANSYGQLGVGRVSEQENKAIPVSGLGDVNEVVKVVGGGGHTLLLNNDLMVVGWNKLGQLGLGDQNDRFEFTRCKLDVKVVDFAAGWDFSLLLSDGGDIWSSGSNKFSQLGQGRSETVSSNVFIKVNGLTNVKRLSAGLRHAGSVDSKGQVWMWGANSKGQLGLDKSKPVSTATLIRGLPKVRDIVCGQYFTLVVTELGELLGCGDNKYGQLGQGELTFGCWRVVQASNSTPLLPSVSCGWTHVVCLTEGVVTAWGRSNYHQLGVGDPVIPGVVTKALAGSEHCICLTNKGRILSWGWNEHGNCGLGDNVTEDVNEPTEVISLSGIGETLDIFTGSAHNFALCVDRII